RLFHVLLTLLDGDLHGYGIIQAVEERTGGDMVLEPGGLYRTLRGMLRDGLIVETDERPDPGEDDPRRRYYRITEAGRAVALAETRRLRKLLSQAEPRVVADGGGTA
ncbi:MAG TPA: PadR family transcriptional regulator, partial [Longimicrobiales bacterium]|nr:PadR family transcriptional regulator [Longimicrobiales bacterium]